MNKQKKLRAIDLYSGVGGWSLGLRLADIEIVASYEFWGPANETNFKNNLHQAQTVDIRRLSPQELPSDIDIIVGSPPCTQFSYSNRGGNGDIEDGLRDIKKFLSIIDYVQPKYWAMENVPRVASVIQSELKEGGILHEFRHLSMATTLVNMEEFGLPQRRKRCIVGNFDVDRLMTFTENANRLSLGEVVKALSQRTVVDPIYGLKIRQSQLFDNVTEAPLNIEETRINRANKTLHPVYNSMPFPDRLDRSVRTITATCTRVSRESIVLEDPVQNGRYRRLTVRERASLQGFPITFQFYGSSYSQKLRMIGNAIPPLFSYYMGCLFLEYEAHNLPSIATLGKLLKSPNPLPAETSTDQPGQTFPQNRNFRFAIPSLRLKSGVRFELTNKYNTSEISWGVKFFYGNSKSIISITLDRMVYEEISPRIRKNFDLGLFTNLKEFDDYLSSVDFAHMQGLWSHKGPGATRPFMLLDKLDEVGACLIDILQEKEQITKIVLNEFFRQKYHCEPEGLLGYAKLERNSPLIIAGFLLGSLTNLALHSRDIQFEKSKMN